VNVNSTGNFTAGTTGAYQWQVDGSNLMVGNWPFEEETGTSTEDFSGEGNDGTLVNSPSFTNVDCQVGRCVDFDGSTNYIQASNAITSYPFTLSVWVKQDVSSGGVALALNPAADASVYYTVGASPPTWWLGCRNPTARDLLVGTSDLDWHLLTAVFESDTSRSLYVDGVLAGTNTESCTFNGATDTVLIGLNRLVSPVNYWNGRLDEPQIYSRALSSTQITQLYNDGNTNVGAPSTIVSAETVLGEIWDLTVSHLGSVGASAAAGSLSITGEFEASDVVLNAAREDQDLTSPLKSSVLVPVSSSNGQLPTIRLLPSTCH